MKNKCRRMLAVFCTVAVVCSMTGCSKDEVVQSETQENNFIEGNKTTEENNVSKKTSPQEPEALQDDTVNYGDTITISCTVYEQPIIWKDAGEAVFEVSTASAQFQNEFDLAEEVTMEKVQEAIGEFVGDSFTLVFEGGDGQYFYEYTIQEIVDKSADKVAYGDKVYVSYEMKSLGVDRTGELETGEQILHLIDTDLFLSSDETENSTDIANERIQEILGKGIGDTFVLSRSFPECGEKYRYTIKGIDKAVEYGDTIKATVRQACILAGEEQLVSGQENLELKLLTPQGTICIAGNELNMADTMMFLKGVQGMHIGDRGYFYTLTDSIRRNYSFCIQDIVSGEAVEAEYDVEPLMLSEEENSIYFCNDDEKAPIVYAIVTDAQNHMVYHYSGGYGTDYFCERSYSYEPEYDEQGRLMKETYGYQWTDRIYEYKYNEQNVCIERKCTDTYDGSVEYEYYDEQGELLRSESYHANGEKNIREYENGLQEVMTVYTAQGEVRYKTIWEYDEYGTLQQEEVHHANGAKYIGKRDEWGSQITSEYYEATRKYIVEYLDANGYEYETTYYDADGNVISEEEYNRLGATE